MRSYETYTLCIQSAESIGIFSFKLGDKLINGQDLHYFDL